MIHHIIHQELQVKQKTVYFGAGWFTETQNKAYKDAMSALNANPTVDLENSYVPLQNQYKDIRVDIFFTLTNFNKICLKETPTFVFLKSVLYNETRNFCLFSR